MKILVIEDDREAARYLEKAFSEAGHSADIAGDGETGYALAENGSYDVLVVDRMLPKRDGLSVVAGLRAKGMDYMQSFLIDSPQDLVESIDAIFTHDGEPTMGIFDAMQDYQGPASLENIKALAGMGADLTTIAVTKDLLEQFNIVHLILAKTDDSAAADFKPHPPFFICKNSRT